MDVPLFKIPCILVAAVGIHVSFHNPNSNVSNEERVPITSLSEKFLVTVRTTLPLLKGVIWGVGLIEATTILAREFSSSPIASRIFSILSSKIPNADADLRLTPTTLLGVSLIAGGALLRYYCYRTLKHLFTFEVSIRDDHQLVTSGPYSVVRHPSYTGLIMVGAGMALWFMAPGAWVRECGTQTVGGRVFFSAYGAWTVAMLAMVVKRVVQEDAALKQLFGKQWIEWAERVRYRLIPWVY